jgi:hypothetical protein
MFEPFHPRLVPALAFLTPHQYYRPHSLDRKTKKIAASIFNGSFTDTRVDSRLRSGLHRGLLIKDISANLLCYAMCLEFPRIKPVMLIRNPFAVALSKLKTKHWRWPSEPLDFFRQSDLHADHLMPYADMIKKTSAKKDFLLNQVLIWSIIHYVPLRQFSAEDIHICFYEDIYADPEREIRRIMRFARHDRAPDHIRLPQKIITQPSWVSGRKSNVTLGTSPVTSWKAELEPGIINEGFDILDCFGLAGLYDSNGLPCHGELEKLGKNRAA